MKRTALPVIGRRLERRAARVRYFAAGVQCEWTLDRLETRKAESPTERARILTAYAHLQSSMALLNAAGWNPGGNCSGKTSRDITATHEAIAELVALIASTEVAEAHNRARGPAEWETAFGSVLDALTTVLFAGDRSDLLNRLYRLAHPVVGGDVAEVAATLRYSYNLLALNQPAHFAAQDGSTS